MGNFSNPAECYVFNDGNSNNILPWMAAMNNGGGFGGAMNSPFWALIVLAFLRQWGFDGNGVNGGGSRCQLSQIQEQLQTLQGQNSLMNAITNANGGVKELASTLNCDFNAVQGAINAVQSAICNVGSKNDMSAMQIVNAVNSGNSAIANQIAQCCCDNKLLTTQQGYESRINNLEQSNMITRGFSDVNYATQAQTNALAQNNDANTRAILAKLDQIEDSRKDREINTLTAQLATVNARAERQAELAPIAKALADIQCKQVSTITVPNPSAVAVPACVAWQAGYGLNPWMNGGNFG